MKQFIIFISAVFLFLFIAHVNKNQTLLVRNQKPSLKIFSYASFSSKWGPGPALKEAFEKNCNCEVEFVDSTDSGVILQRLKIEGEKLGADLVIGFDQYDLQKATVELNWRSMDFSTLDIDPQVKSALKNEFFVPYDWGVLSFITRKNSQLPQTTSLDDLLKSQYAGKIALQDPRTSSVGLQFVIWILKTKGADEGYKYLQKMISQAHSFSPSWSTAYGLFKAQQADLVLSYVTSPLYHVIEEKTDNFIALEMLEPQPVQVEFAGIPGFCRNCELAENFLNLMLSADGQKIIMQKNYMMPVLKSVKVGTDFEKVKVPFRLMEIEYPTVAEVEDILKKWNEIRRESSP